MNFLGGSFRVGEIFGITVRVHILWVLWVAFRLLGAGGAWQGEALFLAMLFGIVLLHEFGHCLGARSVGGDARDILMWPLGGLAYAAAPMRPWPQFVTVAAGPLVNVILCALSAAVLFLAAPREVVLAPSYFRLVGVYVDAPAWVGVLAVFCNVNYFLLLFNLLPMYPLDGGQIFQAVIWPFVGLARATQVACYVGLSGAMLLGFLGLRGGAGILLFIAIFAGLTCYQRLQMLRYGMVVEDERFTPTYPRRAGRRAGFWSRLFGGQGQRPPPWAADEAREPVVENPNPGGWEAKLAERARLEAEVDRILKKVREQGIHSLSYVERQTLEQATRERQQREREFDRQSRL